MKENICRIVKIDQEALFELIYETFIDKHKDVLDISAVGYSNHFAIDWEKGTFIFTAHKAEDAEGNFIPFPEDIDINQVLAKIPATTDSVLGLGKKYKDYSFEELRELIQE